MCLFIVLMVLFLIAAGIVMAMATTFMWAIIFAVVCGILVYSMLAWLFRWYRSAAMVDHPSSRSALLYTIVIILILIGIVKWHDHRTDHRFDYAQPQIIQIESAAAQKILIKKSRQFLPTLFYSIT